MKRGHNVGEQSSGGTMQAGQSLAKHHGSGAD